MLADVKARIILDVEATSKSMTRSRSRNRQTSKQPASVSKREPRLSIAVWNSRLSIPNTSTAAQEKKGIRIKPNELLVGTAGYRASMDGASWLQPQTLQEKPVNDVIDESAVKHPGQTPTEVSS